MRDGNTYNRCAAVGIRHGYLVITGRDPRRRIRYADIGQPCVHIRTVAAGSVDENRTVASLETKRVGRCSRRCCHPGNIVDRYSGRVGAAVLVGDDDGIIARRNVRIILRSRSADPLIVKFPVPPVAEAETEPSAWVQCASVEVTEAVSCNGSVIITLSTATQPLLSVTVIVYAPAQAFAQDATVQPLLHEYA